MAMYKLKRQKTLRPRYGGLKSRLQSLQVCKYSLNHASIN